MTIRHVIDYYMDGHCMIAFCKVCSAEGDKLIEDCPQQVPDPKKYTPKYSDGPIKKLDGGNQTDKQELLKNRG